MLCFLGSSYLCDMAVLFLFPVSEFFKFVCNVFRIGLEHILNSFRDIFDLQ